MKTKGKVVSENVLDFALDAFSAPNEDEIYQVVQNASIEQIDSVLDRYRTWAALGIVRAPPLEKGELRPYFVTSSGLAAWARGGLDNRDGFKDHTAIWAAVDSIKHRLLYCHSVAIDDAFGSLLYRNSREKTADARDHLLNYISFLLHMAPLLRGSILCPVTSDLYLAETEGATNARWTHVRDRVAAELRGDDFWRALSLDEFLKVAPEDVKRSWERELRKPVAETGVRKGVFLSSCERVGRALSASANAQDRLTTYFPFRYDVNVLSAYQQSVSSRQRSALSRLNLPDYDNWLLSRLIDVELPDLASCSRRTWFRFARTHPSLQTGARHSPTPLTMRITRSQKTSGAEMKQSGGRSASDCRKEKLGWKRRCLRRRSEKE